MLGFKGNETSKPEWSYEFEDQQISYNYSGPTYLGGSEAVAGWEVNISISHKDSGDKVSIVIKS